MKIIAHEVEFGKEGFRLEWGGKGPHDRWDGRYNSFDNPKDWGWNWFSWRWKYFTISMGLSRWHRYPFRLYTAVSCGCRMVEVRAFWIDVFVKLPTWWLWKNGLSV